MDGRYLQHPEPILLLLQEVNASRQGILQVAVVPGLQGVVEGDDGAVAGITHHIGQDLGRAEFLGVVARHEVPHDDAVILAQHHILSPRHVPVGRAEKEREQGFLHQSIICPLLAGGQHKFVRPFHVVQVGVGGVFEAPQVIVGVVANAVAAFHDFLEDVRMLADIVAHQEEGGLDAVLVQQIQYPRRHLGDGTVIEGQVDFLLHGVHPPEGAWIEFAYYVRRLLDEHGYWLYPIRST